MEVGKTVMHEPARTSNANFEHDLPTIYAIWVRGSLAREWAERLGGLNSRQVQAGERLMTELVGTLADQAALAGVLKTLNELGLPIVSVDRLAEVEPLPRFDDDA
jgi:hypothetical protein